MKEIIHKKKDCGQPYEVGYTDAGLPFLTCTGCQHKMMDWVEWDQRYRHFWQEDSRWENKSDQMVCLLGYFAHRYSQAYQTNYSLSLTERGLFRGEEMAILRRVMLNLSSAEQARDYLDWYFQVQIGRRQKRLTKISVLAAPALMNEFKLARKKQALITRDRKIPEGMIRWLEKFAPTVMEKVSLADYGDLRTLLAAHRDGSLTGSDFDSFVSELARQRVIDADGQIANWSS